MPRKKTTVEPDVQPEPIKIEDARPPIPASVLIMRSMPLSQLTHIMLNGSRDKMFVVHSGLMQLLMNAYRRKDTDAFVAGVQKYLEQAVTHVAQAGRREEIPQRVQDLRDLIEQAGLEPVAQRILSVVHATL